MKKKSQLELEARVRTEAGDRCGYCLCPQELVLGLLEIEHRLPTSQGGSDEEQNLWIACRMCNNFKGSRTSATDQQTNQLVQLFNPRKNRWSDHFKWSGDGKSIVGKTSCGRATVVALQLNNMVALTVRANWILAGWHPPK